MDYKMAYAAISDLLFAGHSLSGHERNSLFLNVSADGPSTVRFANASLVTQFGYEDDTRGVATCDWDGDGDLDVWTTNRTAPRLRLLRNNLTSSQQWVAVKLEGKSCNRDGIGAALQLKLPSGQILYQTRRCGEGFLSQNSAWIHFGLGNEKPGPLSLHIRWPDASSETHQITRGRRWHLRQGDSPREAKPLSPVKLNASEPTVVPWAAESRTVIVNRLVIPSLQGSSIQTGKPPAKRSGTLLVFFAPWCLPCVEEMTALTKAAVQLEKAGVYVQALAVPGLDEAPDKSLADSKSLLKKLKWPFAAASLDPDTAGALDIFHRSFLSLRRQLPIPASFLLDARNQLTVIYRGPLHVDQLLEDVKILPQSPETVRQHHLPFTGQWELPVPEASVTSVLIPWKRAGYLSQGQAYLQRELAPLRGKRVTDPKQLSQLMNLCEHLFDFNRLRKDDAGLLEAYQLALEFYPNYVPALYELGNMHGRAGRLDQALPYLERAADLEPNSPDKLFSLGIARVKQGRHKEARDLFQRTITADPRNLQARTNLCRMHIELKSWPAAANEARTLWRALPGQKAVADLINQILPNLPKAAQSKLQAEFKAIFEQARNRRSN